MIVAIEGIDSSGKHTQALAVTAALNVKDIHAMTFDFPQYQGVAGTVIGRLLRGELLVVPSSEVIKRTTGEPDLSHEDLKKSWSLDKAHVLQALMLADRCEHIDLLRTYESAGLGPDEPVLVLDRYVLSAFVYGQVDGLDLGWLETTHDVLPQADITFYLDVSVEESVRRRPDRRDYYEKNLEKLGKVRDRYLKEIAERGEGSQRTFYKVDGMQPVDVITEYIVERIVERARARCT
jgi:thymidylate kinase